MFALGENIYMKKSGSSSYQVKNKYALEHRNDPCCLKRIHHFCHALELHQCRKRCAYDNGIVENSMDPGYARCWGCKNQLDLPERKQNRNENIWARYSRWRVDRCFSEQVSVCAEAACDVRNTHHTKRTVRSAPLNFRCLVSWFQQSHVSVTFFHLWPGIKQKDKTKEGNYITERSIWYFLMISK